MNGFYKFAIGVMRVVMPLWYKIEADGLENLPDEGGYLFVSNHRSNADPILIGIQNPKTQFCFLAKQELFSDGLVGWLLRKLGAVAVDRGAGDVSALEEIEYRLQNGQNALIFPEGTRSKDGKLGHFKTGAALIAAQTGVPVVPVAIMFEDSLHFRSTIRVRYGEAFDIPTTSADDPSAAVLKQVRQEMSKNVAALLEMKDAEPPKRKALPDHGGKKNADRPAPAEKAKSEQNVQETDESAAITKESEVREKAMSKDKNQRNHQNKQDTAKKKEDKIIKDLNAAAEKAAAEAENALGGFERKPKKAPKDTISDAEDAAERIDDAFDDDADYDDEFDDDVPVATPFKFGNPFKKLLKKSKEEELFDEEFDDDEYDDDEELDEDEAYDDDDADLEDDDFLDDDLPEDAVSEDEFLEETKQNDKKSAAEKKDEKKPESKKADEKKSDEKKTEEKKPDEKKDDAKKDDTPKRPAVKADDDGVEDVKEAAKRPRDDEPTDELSDEDFEEMEKELGGGLLGGFSLKKAFKKKAKPEFDDEFDDDFDDEAEDEFDDEDSAIDYEDDDYDDDDDDAVGGKHVDYGRIALILTFVILGIFAIDFFKRLWNDWRSDQGTLNIQNQATSMVDSMSGDSSSETVPAMTTEPPVTAVLQTETTSALATEVTTTASTTARVDNRTTQTVSVANDTVHSGSLILIDAMHQQTAVPQLVPFSSFPYQHLRVVTTQMQVDNSLSTPIINWFNDFFAATGQGNVMVYSTTDTPGYPPYSVAIPERSTGLTMDLSILNEAAQSHSPYTADGNYAWLAEHAADYGFILRYPAEKKEKTGMDGMSWHFRYVGAPHATYMKQNDLCLEEYLEMIQDHTWDSEHLSATVGGIEYEMYYVPASETGATTEIKYPVSATGATPLISGDNSKGFVVAVVKE